MKTPGENFLPCAILVGDVLVFGTAGTIREEGQVSMVMKGKELNKK